MKLWNVLLTLLFSTILMLLGTPLLAQSASDRFDTSVTNLAKDITSNGRQSGVIKIAVLGLSGSDDQTNAFGKMLAEELTAKLFMTRRYKIIERELLVKILKEQKFELSGPVDPTAVKQLGKLLAIDAVLTGSITDTAIGLRINVRLISTTSGEVLGVGSVTIVKDDFVSGFMRMSFLESGTDQRHEDPESKLAVLVKQNGFTFECKRFYKLRERPNSIYVDVVITNLGDERELTLGDHMRSGYNMGVTRVASKSEIVFPIFDIFVGEQTSMRRVLVGNYRHSGLRYRFPSKQPVTVTFDFSGRYANSEIPVTLDLLTSSYGNEHDEILLHLRVPTQK